jgi:ketosteroid isomerase-like protein
MNTGPDDSAASGLPPVVSNYLAASDRDDIDAIVACFTNDANVLVPLAPFESKVRGVKARAIPVERVTLTMPDTLSPVRLTRKFCQCR